MKKEVLKNQIVTIISDNDQTITKGMPVNGTFLVKNDNKNVVFTPQEGPGHCYVTKNPVIYGGKFLSSRMKKNGNISLHGVVYAGTNLDETRQLAHAEVDEFFSKIAVML